MLDHVRPQYAKKFRCIGNKCEDNCCRGWDVIVDKATYQKYQALPALQPYLDEYFELITENPSETRYALIKYTSSCVCPLLSDDQMCCLQKEYGEEYLSVTCATYPRNPRRIDGLMENPLSLSCPEAARLVLLDTQLMPSDDGKIGDRRYSRFLSMADQATVANGNPIRFFWDIREFSLRLVQDRMYPLWQRLFILGMFCKRLDEMITVRQVGAVPKLLRDFAEIAAQCKLRSAMDDIPVRSTVQVEMVMQVVHRCLAHKDPRICRIQECLQDFLRGTGYDTAPYLESCTHNYVEAYTHHYEPFMQEHPFLLENYLINHIFRTRFPFGEKVGDEFDNPQREYLLMCLEFAVIKGLLIGMAGHYREAYGVEHIVKLVQTFSKSMEHSPAIREAINWQGLADANSMSALLKN